jgi:hypothetical protein
VDQLPNITLESHKCISGGYTTYYEQIDDVLDLVKLVCFPSVVKIESDTQCRILHWRV